MLKGYSEDNSKELLNYSINAIRAQGVFAALSLAGFITVGKDFLKLWVPSQKTNELYLIIVIGLVSCSMNAISKPMGAVFSLVNKLKANALINILVGVANFVSMLILVYFTGLGVYGVAITSAVPVIIYSLTYIPIFSAKYINIKVGIWYREIIRFFVLVCWLVALFSFFGMFLSPNTWLELLGEIAVLIIAGAIFIAFAYIGTEQRKHLINSVQVILCKR